VGRLARRLLLALRCRWAVVQEVLMVLMMLGSPLGGGVPLQAAEGAEIGRQEWCALV
jgi:hypothetical protein